MLKSKLNSKLNLRRTSVHALLLVASCGIVLALWACTPARPLPVATEPPLNGAAFQPASSVPELIFTRSDGTTFTTADTLGRTSLFYFGYTHCPEVCPVTLSNLMQVRRMLGADAAKVDMYFITLDPARDTTEQMRTYVANFPGVVGLTGSDSDLSRAQTAFNVVAVRRDMGNGDYMLDHTAAIFLVNPAGQIQLAYPYGTAAEDIVADLQRLTNS